MKDLTDYEKMSRGEAAARYLEDPLFNEILDNLREGAISKLREYDKRDDATAMIFAIEDLRDEFQSLVTTGKNAAKNRQD